MSNTPLEFESLASRIQYSVREKRCAACGKDLRMTGIVGSGSFSDGLFCSLDCYAKFSQPDIKHMRDTDGEKLN